MTDSETFETPDRDTVTDAEPAGQLTALVERLAALEAENARLAAEMADLRAHGNGGPPLRVGVTDANAEVQPDTEPDGGKRLEQVSRRGLLKLAGAGAAGAGLAVVGGTLAAQPAAASNGGAVILGNGANTATSTTAVFNSGTGFGLKGVAGTQSDITTISTAGVLGSSFSSTGVAGISDSASGYGVFGQNNDGVAIQGRGATVGVEGIRLASSGISGTGAVRGDTNASGIAGVAGLSSSGPGVSGVRSNFSGISGTAAVLGDTNDSSVDVAGVAGLSKSGPGVLGRSTTNVGVQGLSDGGGAGVFGDSVATGGRGGLFRGASDGAQVSLVPAIVSTHPTAGAQGDLFVTKGGQLWFCTTGGSTATWKQLA
jgi:hypothetical protein